MLEENELLQLISEIDMYALHYVYVPRLNMQLDVFHNSYGHHRMRTARNMSPFQIWTRGLMEGCGDDHVLEGLVEEDLMSYWYRVRGEVVYPTISLKCISENELYTYRATKLPSIAVYYNVRSCIE